MLFLESSNDLAKRQVTENTATQIGTIPLTAGIKKVFAARIYSILPCCPHRCATTAIFHATR